ncbi:MAG: trehalose-phosphatase [Gemmatimonadetes bacterium]|nr:trehalose-phosphatase [Gemmatimonadota bacterium]
MTRLRDHTAAIVRALLTADPAVVALDYDGTLTEIVPDPDHARLTPARRRVLAKASRLPRVRLVVLSGRCCADASLRVGVDGIPVVGNHGLELEGWRIPDAERWRESLVAFLERLAAATCALPRVNVEDKGLTATVHLAEIRSDVARDGLLRELGKLLGEPAAGGDLLRLHPGKASVEVRPAVDWDKAGALRLLLERWGALPANVFYAGDDVTDECVFREVAEGFTVKVGEGESHARYRAEGPEEVYDFLRVLGGDLPQNPAASPA